MARNLFAGSGRVTGLLFRESRFKMMVWLVALISISLATPLAYIGVYQNETDISGFAQTMKNPAMVAMLGIGYEVENYDLAMVFANEMFLFTAIAVGVMNVLLAGQATRADEELGRLELVRALPVGRLAYSVATLVLIVAVNGILALSLGAGLTFVPIEEMTVTASFLYGCLLAGIGVFFAAVTIVLAQMTTTARGTTQMGIGILLLSYGLRAIGDVQDSFLSYLSPLGLAQRAYVFHENAWWPVLVLAGAAFFLGAAGFYLNAIRDIGSGLLGSRSSKGNTSFLSQSLLGVYLRLELVPLVGWAVGMFLMSAAFGAILGDLEAYFSDLYILQAFFPPDPAMDMAEQFVVLLIVIMSNFSAFPVIAAMLRPRKEENLGRMEHVLSLPIQRSRILGSSYVIALLTGVVMQAAIGLGLYVTLSAELRIGLGLGQLLQAATWYLLGLWFILSLAAFMVGWLPQAAMLVWGYTIWTFLVTYLGDLFELPDWLLRTSVFHIIPTIPFGTVQWELVLGYGLGAVMLTVLAFAGYRKRDIHA